MCAETLHECEVNMHVECAEWRQARFRARTHVHLREHVHKHVCGHVHASAYVCTRSFFALASLRGRARARASVRVLPFVL